MSRPSKYTKELIQEAVSSSLNFSEVLRKLNANPSGNTRKHIKTKMLEYGISTEHFTYEHRYTPKSTLTLQERYLKKITPGTRTPGKALRKAMLNTGLVYMCAEVDCPNPNPLWKGKPLTLEVDHIDGDYTNNLISNLRFLCPNCHTQTETFGYKGEIEKEKFYCSCGKEIKRNSKQCVTCSNRDKTNEGNRHLEKNSYPPDKELISGVEKYGYLSYAPQIGLTDNGLRKLLIRRGIKPLPRKLTKRELADSIV